VGKKRIKRDLVRADNLVRRRAAELEYLGSALRELKGIAASLRLPVAAYLLDVAALEISSATMTLAEREAHKEELRKKAMEHLRAAEDCARESGDDALRTLIYMARMEVAQLLGTIGNATDMLPLLRDEQSSH
jgi:hypothetical protein